MCVQEVAQLWPSLTTVSPANNTGSLKSLTVTEILQTLFCDQEDKTFCVFPFLYSGPK